MKQLESYESGYMEGRLRVKVRGKKCSETIVMRITSVFFFLRTTRLWLRIRERRMYE